MKKPMINPETGKVFTWAEIDEALRVGKFGLPGGSSLKKITDKLKKEAAAKKVVVK